MGAPSCRVLLTKLKSGRLSYSYDLTNTLQVNLTKPTKFRGFNARFMWNYNLVAKVFRTCVATSSVSDLEIDNAISGTGPSSPWVLPLVHGSVDQASQSNYWKNLLP